MTSTTFNAVKFVSQNDTGFGTTVRKRVSEYFKTKNISRKGDYRIWIKVILLPTLYLAPFAIVLSNSFYGSLWAFYSLWVLMGIGLAGCGLGIMHDACHGALSKNQKLNNFIGELILNLSAGSSINWKIQHNVLHHSFTNIDGLDEDIEPHGLMRFSPHQPAKPFYRFQSVYAWFLYGLMTFGWATTKDFKQLSRYNAKGLIKQQGATYRKEMIRLIIQKVLYYSFFIALPLFLVNVGWWHVIIGWFCMHFVAGLILGCVFQPAHVVPTSEYPLPDNDNNVDGDLAKHQLLTTTNFAPSNRLLSWYVGGLNYQIEHHLFPTMSHVHHREISKIVKKTAEEFGVPYYSQSSFIGALVNHAKMLHKLRK
jgi:linoleoyl-CoA desaturase